MVRPPTREVRTSHESATASQWVSERAGIRAPELRFASAEIAGTERTADSGCYCLVIWGRVDHLGFSRREDNLEGATKRSVEGRDYWMKGEMVSFRGRGFDWTLRGDDAADAWAIAKETLVQK